MKKKYLCLILCLLSSPSFASISGSCAPLDEDGNEIGTCTWTLDGDTLTFSGKGPMKDYGTIKQGSGNLSTTDAPWNDRDSSLNTGSLYQIRNVVVEDGITSVGAKVMSGAYRVTNIIIGDDVKSIGKSAFYACYAENVQLGKNLETIKADAFHTNNITNLVLPNKLKEIGSYALWGVMDENIVLPSSIESVASGLPVNKIRILYCEEKNEKLCQDIVEKAKNDSFLSQYSQNLSYRTYAFKGGRYIFDGTAYKSIADYYNKEPVKRIYTVEEANKASGKVNTVKIRYK